MSLELAGFKNSTRMFHSRSASSNSNLSPAPSSIGFSSDVERGGAAVTMKSQCFSVRGAHLPEPSAPWRGFPMLGWGRWAED